MSLFGTLATGIGVGAGMQALGAVTDALGITVSRPRRIDTLMPHVVAEEAHHDELAITDHPVERGAFISDHAFKLPAQLILRCGWSNSSQWQTIGEGYIDQVYDALLALQAEAEPFSVFTGKRLYDNMLIHSLTVTTDQHSENILEVTARLREVIIVETVEAMIPPRDAQADPANTESPTDRGATALGSGIPNNPSNNPWGGV